MTEIKKFWLKASFDISSKQLEQAELILLEHGATSVCIEDAKDEPLFEPLPGETPLWENSRLSALYSEQANEDQLNSELSDCLQSLNIGTIQIEKIEDRQWERAWMDNFQPLCFADRLWIVPTHCQPPDPEAVNLAFDPGLAFGTGSHPTTALCLEWLAEHELNHKSIIDYGCGSGILAIAAAKLGANPIYATDIDEQALSATQANAKLNQIQQGLILKTVEEFHKPTVDIVLANILSNILIELSDTLSSCCVTNGRLVLSGLLQNQISDVMDAYAPRFQFLEPRVQEDWVLLEGIRKI